MRGLHSHSHVMYRSSGHVANQKCFIFTFTRCKAHKLSRVATRMRRPHPTCHVTPRSYRQVITIQQVVYIKSTSSRSSLLKSDRFQMTVTILKVCSLHIRKFLWWRITFQLGVYMEKISPQVGWLSRQNNLSLCLYVVCSISPDQAHVQNHVIKISLSSSLLI